MTATTRQPAAAPAALVVEVAPRSFVYNGVTLADMPGLDPEQVKAYYAHLYPELTNATIEGPEPRNGVLTWSFVRQVGSKG